MIFKVFNPSSEDLFLVFAGGHVRANDFMEFEGTDITEDKLQTSAELKNLINTGGLIPYLDGAEVSKQDAIRFLTQVTKFNDATTQRYRVLEDSKSVIEDFTQLQIIGRPLILEAGSELTVGEGADIIL